MSVPPPGALVAGLYGVLDPRALPAAAPGGEVAARALEEALEQALEGGCRIVQYRDKDASPREALARARRLARLCRARGALFLVNDRLDVALLAGAAGCHLGQDDLPAACARRLAPPGFVLGVSASSPEEARQAERDGADYVGVGAVFPTASKADAGPARGPGLVALVAAAVSIPVVAIGGITTRNVAGVIRAGAAAAAVLSDLFGAADIRARAAEFVRIWERETARR